MNFFEGRCHLATSPLLGSDGISGEYWTLLGNLLLERNAFDAIVLAPAAVSGSEISRWGPSGDLNRVLTSTADQLTRSGYRVTHVIWVQGEIDYVKGTSYSDYRDRFLSLVTSLRSHGVTSPIYVAVATKCLGQSNGGTRFHDSDNPIAHAQLQLPDTQVNLRSGINSDALLDELDRYDDCHFGASGEDKVARAWAELIANGR